MTSVVPAVPDEAGPPTPTALTGSTELPGSTEPEEPTRTPSVWWSRRAIGLHLALLFAVPSFLVLGGWQLHRALQGNILSWAYVFEWPFFSVYAVWMWWKLVHDDTAPHPRKSLPGDPAPPSVIDEPDFDPYDEADPELAAYNRYLAELRAADKPKTWSR